MLLVPIHLDALVLDEDKMVVEAMADFSRLPYCDGKADINPDVANISEEIVSPPFQNQNLPLKAGIHLHWSLPDALTRARHTAEGRDFPPVPNRWLVTRFNKGVKDKEWIVESDYLYTDGEDHSATSVTIPYRPDDQPRPFRYMGRSFEPKVPQVPPINDPKAKYYPKLTAVGYGEPTFAAFYPNCHSVFGFYDGDPDSVPPIGLSYEVVGWYVPNALEGSGAGTTQDSDPDFLHEFAANASKNDPPDIKATAATRVASLEKDVGWTVALEDVVDWFDKTEEVKSFLKDMRTNKAANSDMPSASDFIKAAWDKKQLALAANSVGKFPTQMLCYARLTFDIPVNTSSNLVPAEGDPVAIAVGNTGTEALSAYLAQTLVDQTPVDLKVSDSKTTIEDQLEAIQLSAQLEHRQLDIDTKFLEARHEKGFNAIPGGSLWTIRPESTTTSAADVSDADTEITLPDEMAELLNTLNHLQQDYDGARQEIASMRKQLFSDWYKYMLCAYPPEDARDEYPDIDEVKSYLEANVASLNDRIVLIGTLTKDEHGKFSGADDDPCSLAATLSEAINDLQTKVDAHNKALEGAAFVYRLKKTSGPRYWQPTEPVVLIQGAIVKASERHGQDGRSSDGLLETQILANEDPKGLPDDPVLRAKIRERIDEIGKPPTENFAFSTWTAQPWNPFLLEWEVEVFPIANKSNLDPKTGRYASDFINDNYTVSENQVDLSLKPDNGAPTTAANIYSGRSILTPHAGIQLTKQIEAYLVKTSWLLEADDIRDAKALCDSLRAQKDPLSSYWFNKFNKSTPDLFDESKPPPEATVLLALLVVQLKALLKDPSLPGRQQSGATVTSDDLSQARLMRANRVLLENNYASDLAQTSAGLRQAFDNIEKAYDHLVDPKFNCLSQSLGGFNEALLMHKQTMQLGISDPLGFDDYQSFATSVSAAVRNSIYSAPEPLNDFNPIRSGAMRIIKLRLVDTFGQIKDLIKDLTLPEEVITSEPMTNSGSEFHVRLAPRLVQPARLNFRWLAADSDEQEMNDHPATTPICGWVLTNNLDNSLMIYDNQGKALGSLAMKDTDPLHPTWASAPGGGADAVDPKADIKNLHLQKMVSNIQTYEKDFLNHFISAINTALENIEPENFAQHQDLALLMGRPIALVRASVNLELQGLPAVHQGWNEFRQDLQRVTRDDNGFSDVRFPIRIGEFKQFNDGTVGYWKDNKSEKYDGDVFYAPQSDDEPKHDPINILQSVNSEPQILSLLVDPRGLVHATCGVLPAKAISIPPDQYAAALQAIEITFLSTPILTDVGKMHLPLPAEAGYQWSWLQQDGQKAWTEISSRGIVQKTSFAGFESGDVDALWAELIAQAWIVIDPQDQTRASVTAKDQRKNQSLSLPDKLKDKTAEIEDITAEIEDILDRAHLGPINPAAKFSGPQEIREGWLKLSADKVSANSKAQAAAETVIANPKQ